MKNLLKGLLIITVLVGVVAIAANINTTNEEVVSVEEQYTVEFGYEVLVDVAFGMYEDNVEAWSNSDMTDGTFLYAVMDEVEALTGVDIASDALYSQMTVEVVGRVKTFYFNNNIADLIREACPDVTVTVTP